MNTELDDLAATLRQIASGSRRSKIVRLREIFDLVEEAKAKGASNKEIVAGLKEHGLVFDVPNFKNARSRILKERAMEALLLSTPIVNEIKSPRISSKVPSAKPIKPQSSSGKSIKGESELERPPGISNATWSEMQVKARAEKRKLKLNSGE